MQRFLFLLLLCCSCLGNPAPTIQDMSLAQAPSITPSFPNTISPPYDGDPLSATQLRVEDLTPIQNGIEASRLLLRGGNTKLRVKCTSNTVLVVQPLGAVLATVGGTEWTTKAHTTASTIDPSALAGGLAANTRYWVYASLVAGVVTFSVSTTAPDVGLSYKNGDTGYMFVSTFYTDATPDILLYSQTGLDFSYESRASNGGNLILNGGSSFAGTATVAFNGSIPAQATAAMLHGQLLSSNTALQFGYLGIGPAGPPASVRMLAKNGLPDCMQIKSATVSGLEFTYSVQSNTEAMSVWAAGFSL